MGEVQDPVSGRSQILRCSRGKLNYIPACATTEQSCTRTFDTISFVNGVLRVPINNNVAGIASGTVVNWVEAEAQSECLSMWNLLSVVRMCVLV